MIVPEAYVVQKFFEYGYNPQYNRYNNTYQCGCPICMEGKSLGRSKRCYYIPEKDLTFCHNCGWSSKPLAWITRISGSPILEIIQEVKALTKDDTDYKVPVPKVEKVVNDESLPEDCINLFDEQQVEFYKDNEIVQKCMKVIKSRKLDTAVNRPDALYVSLTDKYHGSRLVIPFMDEHNKIVFYQSRSVTADDLSNRPKYTSKLNAERSLFNINKVTAEIERVFIFEGPIDSFCVRNGLAVAGITEKGSDIFNKFQQIQSDNVLRFHKRVWVLDSQWKDQASLTKTEFLLKNGEEVYIWPKGLGTKFKDFNDIICASTKSEIPGSFIECSTYKGLTGILKLGEIKDYLSLR